MSGACNAGVEGGGGDLIIFNAQKRSLWEGDSMGIELPKVGIAYTEVLRQKWAWNRKKISLAGLYWTCERPSLKFRTLFYLK